MLWILLLVVLVLLLVGSAPVWPYSAGWGYSPAGVLAIVVVVLVPLWATGVIHVTAGAGTPPIQTVPQASPRP